MWNEHCPYALTTELHTHLTIRTVAYHRMDSVANLGEHELVCLMVLSAADTIAYGMEMLRDVNRADDQEA